MEDPRDYPSAGKQNLPGFRTPGRKVPLPRTPGVVLQPKVHRALQRGIDLIVEAVRPTLGPLPRLVALERLKPNEAPEFLDDGATIARRIIEIVPREYDVGAMLIRNALWRMHLEAGDGSSTMAVICQVLVDEGVRAIIQFGCHPMLLREGLEKGLRAVQEALRQDVIQLAGREEIARMARGLVQGHDELAKMLGEVFDIVGPDGFIAVDKGNRLGLEREYVEGTYWDLSGWFSPLFVTEPSFKRTVFEDAALLISDFTFQEPGQLTPVLEQCAKAGVRKLVIIAKEVSDRVIGLLVKNNQARTIETMAVRTPRVLEMDRVASMEDIAVLTGGRAFCAAAHPDLRDFRLADLGHARRAWATDSQFGVFGGSGDPRRIRQHILNLRGMLKLAEDEHTKEMLQERLGRLAGGTAILRVGGATETEAEALKGVALRAVTTLRKAISGGVVPGGGAALLNARRALETLAASNESEAIAFKILGRALEEPMRAIAKNAGYQPDVILEKVKASPPGYGFDARSGRIVDMRQIGVLDALLVLERALEIAVSCAGMVLTTDIIVQHRKPQECIEP